MSSLGQVTRVRRNWAESLNMMTANLRRTAYAGMQKENMIGKIQDDQASSEFQLRSLDAAKDDPLIFAAFGVKEIQQLHSTSGVPSLREQKLLSPQLLDRIPQLSRLLKLKPLGSFSHIAL